MSKDIQKGYFSKRSMIIAVVITAGIFIGSVGWYVQTSSADLTDQEVYRIIKNWHDDNPHLFVSQEELAAAHQVINQAIAAPHLEFDGINSNFTSIAKVLDNHNTQLIVLRAQAQISIPDVSQGTGDFDLKTINIQTFQITTEFPQNMPVYITGSYDGLTTTMDYDIYKNGILYATGNPSITAGTFTFAYNVNGNAEIGEYTVTVIIDNRKDTISFTIE